MLLLLLVVTLTAEPLTEREVKNYALYRQVRQSLPRYNSQWNVVVSDDGGAVFFENTEINRFSTVSHEHDVHQNLFVDRVDGSDLLRTSKQRGGDTGLNMSGVNRDYDPVRVIAFSSAIFAFGSDRGSYVVDMNFGPSAAAPRHVSKSKLFGKKLSADNTRLIGFQYEDGETYFESYAVAGARRLARIKLPPKFYPKELDADRMLVLGMRQHQTPVSRAAVLDLRDGGITLFSQPSQTGHYWFGGDDVYFQGDRNMYVGRNGTWHPVSDDLFIGKSANGKYWLVRRNGVLYLQRRG
jgi:hypothetical protein